MTEAVPYFAFGANTCRDVLVRRRRIEPIASEAAELRDHRLAFVQPGLRWIEPAFASVLEAPGCTVHGVLHLLRPGDLERLDRYESRAHARLERTVHAATRGPLRAWMYVARRPVFGRAPSRRYVELLVRGAREHGLPEAWIRELEATPCVHVPVLARAMPSLAALVDRLLGARGR